MKILISDKDTKRSGIYIIENTYNNRFYVGSAIHLGKRVYLHKKQLENNNHHSIFLQRDYNKRSGFFEIRVLEFVENAADLIDIEQMYLSSGICHYNLDKIAGSPFGRVYTEEQRRKRAEIWLGKKHTPETRKKMSEVQTLLVGKGVILIDENGLKHTFKSHSQAARSIGCAQGHIARLKEGKLNHSKGWAFHEDAHIYFCQDFYLKNEELGLELQSKFWRLHKDLKLLGFDYRLHDLLNGKRSKQNGWVLIKRSLDIETFLELKEKFEYNLKTTPRNITKYKFKSPEGIIFEGENITKFDEEHSLNKNCLSRLMQNAPERKQHKGWTAVLD
jgi:predicted GIY-YIG superfamily endonuclease